jgi:hypothetical protein
MTRAQKFGACSTSSYVVIIDVGAAAVTTNVMSQSRGLD